MKYVTGASLIVIFSLFPTSEPANNGRIIGGSSANAGQFPSSAAIYVTTSGGSYFCGGSLINQQWILTAAHCIIPGYHYDIVLGSTTLKGTDPNRIIVSTAYRVIHPFYNYNTLQHDIALIKLRIPIEFTDYIQPINLPESDVDDDFESVAIGWGQTSDKDAGLADYLNYVTVRTIPNQECQISFSSTIFDNMVCIAGNYNEGTCNGDSGSPLIAEIGNKQYHVGISSFLSSKGCESTDPSGYTRTFPYVEWVKNHAIVDSVQV